MLTFKNWACVGYGSQYHVVSNKYNHSRSFTTYHTFWQRVLWSQDDRAVTGLLGARVGWDAELVVDKVARLEPGLVGRDPRVDGRVDPLLELTQALLYLLHLCWHGWVGVVDVLQDDVGGWAGLHELLLDVEEGDEVGVGRHSELLWQAKLHLMEGWV